MSMIRSNRIFAANPGRHCWAALAVVLAVPVITPAVAHAAATTPPGIAFNEALQFSYNPGASGINYSNPCCDYINVIKAAPASPAISTYSQSGPWGSVTGFASADLATGQLKMRSAVVDTDGTTNPSLQSNAIFGDSFTAQTPTGSPFTWNSASQAAFTVNLNGSLTSSAPLATVGGDVFVVLSILKAGTLDPDKPLVNGPTAIQYFFWNIGNPGTKIYYTDQQGNSQPLIPTAEFTTIPASLNASFNPSGNFDWVLLLGADGQLGTAGSSFDLDLSHTATLSYAGPDGSVTTAGSGQFKNFDATLPPTTVPEPATLALLSISAFVAAAWRRRLV